jgi:transposase
VSPCLPTPYSPDFNPIKQAFAKSKQALRRRSACSREAVVAALASLVPALPSGETQIFFAEAGFPITVQ